MYQNYVDFMSANKMQYQIHKEIWDQFQIAMIRINIVTVSIIDGRRLANSITLCYQIMHVFGTRGRLVNRDQNINVH